jgi:hypothetical protein
MSDLHSFRRPTLHRTLARRAVGPCLVALLLTLSGCGAIHPIRGIPVGHLPYEFLGPSRDGLRPINPMLLTRSQPPEHVIDAGDVLSIYIPGVLGTASAEANIIGETPPIHFPHDRESFPTLGFPIQVRGDGTISLPQIPPVLVRGMTLRQVEDAVRRAYTEPRQIIADGRDRILVSLQREREYRVLVVREDSTPSIATSGVGTINLGNSRRGSARVVSLKAFENDVMHALAREQGVDGLPGLDAEGAIYVIRRRHGAGCGMTPATGAWQAQPGYGAMPQGATHYVGNAGAVPGGAMPAGTVIRYQSPSDDYRSSRGRAYSGHSIGAATPTPYANPRGSEHVSSFATRPATSNVTNYRSGAAAMPSGGVSMTPTTGHSFAMTQTPAFVDSRTLSAPSLTPSWTGPAQFPATQMPVMAQQAPQSSQVVSPIATVSHYESAPVAVQSAPAAMQYAPVQPYAAGPQMMASPAHNPAMVDDYSWSADPYFNSMVADGVTSTIDGPGVLRIPIRIAPGETLQISEQDVTLLDGDIVFIESRCSEVFYTGGLLGGGQYTLPRDYDLRALEAVSLAQSSGARQGGGQGGSAAGVSALNQDVTISASRLIIVRQLDNGSRVPIEIDLNHAKRDMTGSQNIIIQPGDYLYLQYSFVECVGAFFERHLLEGALFGVAAAQFQTGGN